jgi:hypothetical protein
MAEYAELAGRLFANAMIVAMLFWIFYWDKELSHPIRKYWIPVVQAPFTWLGLNAEWRMFAFDPPQRDIWPLVVMTLANGDVATWEPTPYSQLTVRQKRGFKKMHKYYYTVVGLQTGKQIHRDFLEHIMRQNPQPHPVVTAELYCVALDAPPFGSPEGTVMKPYKRLRTTFHPQPPEPS